MKKVILKRKLISSFFFDCGTAQNHMYLPTICFYWDLENAKQPIQIVVKYAWQDFTLNYPFKNFIKYVNKKSLAELAKYEIQNRPLDYKGAFVVGVDEMYLSEFGKFVLCAKSQEEVEKLINKLGKL